MAVAELIRPANTQRGPVPPAPAAAPRRAVQRLRGVPIDEATLEVASKLQAIIRERPGLLGALLEAGHGSLVIELPMRDWEWSHYKADLKTTGEMPDAA